MKKIAFSILILILLVFTISGCTYSAENYVFGTYYSVKIDANNSYKLGKEIDTTLKEMDNALSTNIIESDVTKINNSSAGQKVKVTTYTVELFKISKELYAKTNHAFNPASFPLTELWNFSPAKYTGIESSIPTQAEIESKLPYCNMDMFVLDEVEKTITKLNDNAKLDFGAIAKGYAADIVYNMSTENQSKRAIIDIGRTFKVLGDIDIYVANPREGDFVAKATINNQAVATSGDYERYYIINNVRYHHIIDQTGYPAGLNVETPIISATIVGESATICDALSTATIVLGYQNIKPIIDAYGYSALLLTETGYYTIGENLFEIQDQTRQKLN